MTSGKASRRAKQQAPTPTKRTPTTGRGRKASPRVLAAGAAGIAAIVAAVVLAVTLGGGSSKSTGDLPAIGSLATNLTGASDVATLFKGIPQTGNTLGKASAPVTMTEFIDLQCPSCRAFETSAFPEIVQRWVRTGKLRVDMQAWAFIGPDSLRGRSATIAAGDQGRAFDYAALLYSNQGAENAGWLDDEMVGRVAAAIPGFDVQKLLTDRGSPDVKTRATAVDARATTDHVNSTPTILVGRTGTKGEIVTLTSLDDPAPIDAAIKKALKG